MLPTLYTEHAMRRRERTYFLLLGTVSSLALLAGAWPVPLLAFALLELSFSGVEVLAGRRRSVSRSTARQQRRYEVDAARGILQTAP
jgi:hypothetical protein